MRKILLLGFVSGLLLGCSSPPKPVSPDFEGKKAQGYTVNKTMPIYAETKGVIQSPIAGAFELIITRYQNETLIKDNELQFYYAVAHSKSILVVAENLDDYVKTRQWLEELGATAPIHFKQQNNLLKDTVTMVLSSKSTTRGQLE